ncbi:uncharacterized protein MYCGRDRAFT_43901 [Zymoseptoria tritici IPO323]|uniref:RNA ligase/cyclic nucleotide phosphodiesterase n=1 Tax=Zymoseptoria tritici (strain CBS 115943 / IPO323) TaxID=336722 RepID=F9XDK4_ZYMTI|nr:uncharacterized protein MYCGRDRAFT_43901 [Zymoseptoria tritici IPO323]EGP86511.1 hypothetical protein MYCGRDRAFT_43901 [Zymoseptoria tritici IPO323]
MAVPSSSAAPPNNPYSDLITSCSNDPTQIQSRYLTHRSTRNTQQRSLLLSPSFQGVKVDDILYKLSHPDLFPGYEDPRHCLVVWARPTEGVRRLVGECQRRLKEVVPNLWLMPSSNLHMTAMEVTHSRTPAEIEPLVDQITPHLEPIFTLPHTHRVELIKPYLSFDAQAIALSFAPAAATSPGDGQSGEAPTYHHLRRDLHALLTTQANTSIASRYVTPSAHLTIARFIEASDFLDASTGEVDRGKVEVLVETVEGVNRWLEEEFWTLEEGEGREEGARWVVGEERGLEVKRGALWYGGGERVGVGEGFWMGGKDYGDVVETRLEVDRS